MSNRTLSWYIYFFVSLHLWREHEEKQVVSLVPVDLVPGSFCETEQRTFASLASPPRSPHYLPKTHPLCSGILSSLLKFSLITRGGSDLQWENTSLLRTFVDHKRGRNLSVKLICLFILKDCIYSVKEFTWNYFIMPLYPSYSSLFYSFILFNSTVIFFEIIFMMNSGTKGVRGVRGFVKSLQ